MYNIAIRADGGPQIGIGHIMRCLAIAEELKDLGHRVYFISKYREGIDKIILMGFQAYKLSENESTEDRKCPGFNYGNVNDLETDLAETRLVIQAQSCDLLIVDKYNLCPEYFKKLKDFVSKVAYIDDLNLFECPANIIINGNITAFRLGYKVDSAVQKLLLGTSYTPLRREFKNVGKRKVDGLVNNMEVSKHNNSGTAFRRPEVMITTGGSDPYNCTGKLLEALLGAKKTGDYRYNIVVGTGFVFKEELIYLSKNTPNVVLYIDYNRISEVMCRSDLAISSGGSTLYELCCCGTPTLAFILADNQIGIVEGLAGEGYLQSIGWYNNFDEIDISKITGELINDIDIRSCYSRKMQKLVDGKGAVRIADELVKVI